MKKISETLVYSIGEEYTIDMTMYEDDFGILHNKCEWSPHIPVIFTEEMQNEYRKVVLDFSYNYPKLN